MSYAKPQIHSDRLSSKLHALERALLEADQFGSSDLRDVVELRQEAERLEEIEDDLPEVEKLKDKVVSLEEEVAELTHEVQEADAATDSMNSERDQAELEISRLEGIVESLEGTVETYKRDFADVRKHVKRLVEAPTKETEAFIEALVLSLESMK